MKKDHGYADMLDLPHHVSSTRPRMPLHDRAAQFAPFAALTGFDAAIAEADRMPDRRVEPGEAESRELAEKLRILAARQAERPPIRVTWFIPDARKAGGRYDIAEGRLKRVRPEERRLSFTDGRDFDLDDIICIEGALFEDMAF